MARPVADLAAGVIPLADSAARLGAAFGRPVLCGEPGPGWTRCADVDAEFVTRWEQAVGAQHRREFGRSHPAAAAAYVLGWYAGVPAELGGALYRLSRRVPRLGRDAVAFRLAAEAYPDAYALLDARFWCLPSDPAADHPDATPVADEPALAAVLRAQVRAHADAFLAQHPSRGRLPRRTLLGAFTDGMDTGLWLGDDPAPERLLPDAALALPAGPSPLPASTLHVLVDGRGRRHVDRRTLSCCYYFTINPAAGPCGTCPRIPSAERLRRFTDLPDEPAGIY
jgi:hypothetical protein